MSRPPKVRSENRVHRERHRLAGMHGPHVHLADRRDDAHLREILRDHEQRRRAEACGHSLADFHLLEDHDAVDRRRERAAIEIHLRVLESGLAREQRRARLFELRFDLVVVGLRDEILIAQVFQAFRAESHECRVRFGGREIGFGLRDALFVARGIDAREDLPFRHLAVEVDVDLGDEARRSAC